MKTKDIIFGIAIGLLLILLLLCKCHPSEHYIKEVKYDTSYIHDTTTITITKPVPVAYTPGVVPTGKGLLNSPQVAKVDTTTKALSIDTPALFKDYFAKRRYSQKVPVKYGTITVNALVTQNTMDSLQVKTDFNTPLITKTITEIPKPKIQLYAGVNTLFNGPKGIYAAGGGLTLKTKSDKLWEVEVIYNLDGTVSYQAGFKVKVSFH